MLWPTVIMGVAALILFVVAYSRGQGQHVKGLKSAWDTLSQTLPLLVFSFIVAGLASALIPRELITQLLGEESGWRGIFIGGIAGALAPGGPYVSLPICAGLCRMGASVGTAVAFLTGWQLWNVTRIPQEVGILGWKLTAVWIAVTAVVPPIAGWLAQLLFGNLNLLG